MNKINKIVFCFSILLLCVSCGNQNETDDGTTSAIVTNDLIIDNETVVYNNEVVNVQGNVIIKNGGVLKIENNCQLNIIGTYDEQFSIIVSGDSKLESYDSIIQGIDYQIAIIGMAANGESPYLYFENTIITLHLGIRPLDQTIVESVNSNIEEIQLRDQSEVHISGGEEIYPVFFFENISGSLSNLKVYEKITETISIVDGWSVTFTNAEMGGYQVDAVGSSIINLTECDEITASIHTPGNLGNSVKVVSTVTSSAPATGIISGLGPEIRYTNSTIKLFNLYVYGGDKVRIEGGTVNEANTIDDNSQLTIVNATLEYNLVQAYDGSSIIIQDSDINYDDSYIPSVTAQGTSSIVIDNSDCDNLQAQAIENGTIYFINITHKNLNVQKLSTQDNGKIYIDDILFFE